MKDHFATWLNPEREVCRGLTQSGVHWHVLRLLIEPKHVSD